MLKGIDNLQLNDYNAYDRIRIERENNNLEIGKQAGSQQEVKEQEAPKAQELDLRLDDIRPRKNATLEDISLSLNDNKAFEMKGKDSDLESLDMEKAVSDMQKDQALMQYQYFVGESNIQNFEDGIVIAK
ncbi:MAG: hypothetical protein K6F87_07450 [Lachnospiraceae bacterium]|nr:hypothetical protein [Lachnospiraceae bacterium]